MAERISRRDLLIGSIAGMAGAVVGVAAGERILGRPAPQPHEALIDPSAEDIRKLEALIEQGRFTELTPKDMVEGAGVATEPVMQLSRREMDTLLTMLADYDITTGIPRLQHQVADSQLGDRSNYLHMGVNHLVFPHDNGGYFNILDTDVRVFGASSGGPVEMGLVNPLPQNIDNFPGFGLRVDFDDEPGRRPNPAVDPIVIVLPK